MKESKPHVVSGNEALVYLSTDQLNKFAEASERPYISHESELPKAMENWHHRMQGVLETGQVSVVLSPDGNEVVSLAGFEEIGMTEDGRPVIEAGKSVTLPDHRENGYYRLAMAHVVEEIRKKYPRAVVIRCTKQNTVRKSADEMGFTKISTERYAAYRKRKDGTELSPKDMEEAEKYDIFEIDLNTKK